MKQARISVIFGPVDISYHTGTRPAILQWQRSDTLAGNTVDDDIIDTRDPSLNVLQSGDKHFEEFSMVLSRIFIPGLVLHKSNIATYFRGICSDDAIKLP